MHATHPILFASYSGVLGGAERVLLDCATRLSGRSSSPARTGRWPTRCGGAARARADRRAPAAARARPRRAHVRPDARAPAARRPAALVAWGARAVLAAARSRRPPPWLAVHHDLLAGRVLAAPRAATGARGRRRRRLAGDRRPARRDAAVLHPGVDLDRVHPRARSRRARRTRSCSARSSAGSAPTWRSRSPRGCPELQLTLAGAPLPGDDGASSALRRARDRRPVTSAASTTSAARSPSAHVLLHCADAEPYGLALVEALAAGRPVVAPAAGGPLEIVTRRRRPPLPARRRATRPSQALRAVLADPGRPPPPARRAEAAFDVTRLRAPRLDAAIDAAIAARELRGRHRPRTSRAHELAALLPTRCELAAASWSSSTPAPTTAAPTSRARPRRGGDRAPRQPRLRRRQQRRRSSTSREDVTVLLNPDTVDDRRRARRARAPSPRAPHAPARAAAAEPRRQRPAQRPPAPGHARRVPARAVHPPLLPTRPERVEPLPSEHAAHRRLGDRRLPRGAHGTLQRSARSTRASTSSPRTWTSACGPATHGIRDGPAPRPRSSRHTGGHSVRARRAVRRARPAPPRRSIEATRGRRAQAPRRRRPGAHVRHPRPGQAPQRHASARSSSALLKRPRPG